jgi:hypothetical protein
MARLLLRRRAHTRPRRRTRARTRLLGAKVPLFNTRPGSPSRCHHSLFRAHSVSPAPTWPRKPCPDLSGRAFTHPNPRHHERRRHRHLQRRLTVRQEIWALLTTYNMLCDLATGAAAPRPGRSVHTGADAARNATSRPCGRAHARPAPRRPRRTPHPRPRCFPARASWTIWWCYARCPPLLPFCLFSTPKRSTGTACGLIPAGQRPTGESEESKSLS